MGIPVETCSRQEALTIPAEQVVRWLAAGGIVLAGCHLISMSFAGLEMVGFALAGWGNGWFEITLKLLPLPAATLALVAGIACLCFYPSARPLLLVSVVLWVISLHIATIYAITKETWILREFPSLRATWFIWTYGLESPLIITGYTIGLFAAFTRPAVKAVFRRRSDRGFEPVLGQPRAVVRQEDR